VKVKLLSLGEDLFYPQVSKNGSRQLANSERGLFDGKKQDSKVNGGD
jgi:hypothetical protein